MLAKGVLVNPSSNLVGKVWLLPSRKEKVDPERSVLWLDIAA